MKESLALGYVGVTGNVSEWRTFATDLYGMQPIVDGDALRLRVDDRAWRFSIEPGPNPGLAYVGIELDSSASLDAVVARVKAAGYDAEENSVLAKKRNVGRLVRTIAVDGTPLELFIGGMVVAEPFASLTGAKFVTGGAGLGHVLMLVPDLQAALHYYTTVLGFRVSDVVVVTEGVDAYFLHGGCRHHVIALASIPGKTGPDHVFVEVDSITTVGRAWDKTRAGAAPIVRELGQHANDPVTSFYTQSPSGFAFEYGVNATRIGNEDEWVFKRWDSIYLWGGQVGPAGHL
ncbi:MAG: VOC family protein [Rhodocyclaceae bacterium]|jgi:2,3-dihydroxybiphenyl 1,2-dioxygenase|nr:VOC family protein [Rhodocyclaceae bacterium]